MWHGNVTEGITDAALKVNAPRACNEARFGQLAAASASGRVPSIITNATNGIVSPPNVEFLAENKTGSSLLSATGQFYHRMRLGNLILINAQHIVVDVGGNAQLDTLVGS
jgi:hypothetical protein